MTTTETKTKHKYDCQMAFGRKDASCPRCQELLNGSKPRASWHKDYFKAQENRLIEIRAHDCKKSGCLPICTAFDW